jgi:cation diffusion facilitator CzcD-associated flavoprotein CzcO
VPSFAVVGAGFGGVGAAVMLRRAGYEDVTVFERGERVGGVWHDNTYPGAACDVPSHLYEFSFAPNPRWSRRYAPQAEIQAYLEDVARREGVLQGFEPAPRCSGQALTRRAPSGCSRRAPARTKPTC